MKIKSALIILNGKNFCRKGFLSELEQKPDLIIAADGGLKHLEGLPVPPVVHIGDMDSSAPDIDVPVKDTLIFPIDKDHSDFRLALEYAHKKNIAEVTVFAAAGGRQDHFLSNYDSAVYFAGKGMKIIFSGTKEDIHFLPCISPREYEFNFRKGSTVSIFSGTQSVKALTINGFKFPAIGLDLDRLESVGLSNVCTDDLQKIKFNSGVLAVIHNKSKV